MTTSEQNGLLALGGIVAIAVGFFVAKRVRDADSAEAAAEAEPSEWTCACGQRYEVQGLDRHRVYVVPGEGPVLGRDCVRCGEPLPAGHDTAHVS
jgi:hypothetical protein